MVAKMLDVTPQAARRIVGELGLREIMRRGFATPDQLPSITYNSG
nr:helix-turn-helix domain-containing protein [Neorhizobium galegae]